MAILMQEDSIVLDPGQSQAVVNATIPVGGVILSGGFRIFAQVVDFNKFFLARAFRVSDTQFTAEIVAINAAGGRVFDITLTTYVAYYFP